MNIDLGTFGIWQGANDVRPETAAEIEALGYGALWVGRSPRGDLAVVEEVLDATESMPVATGIVNMWRETAATVAASYHRINQRHPNRFLLGVGIGHPEATSEYRKPYDTILSYLDDLDQAGVPREHLCLAALGPKVLRVSAERTAGAHPYLTTHRHTRLAREILGDGVLLAPEQTVVVERDPDESVELARKFVQRYLRLVNYRRNLLREGWTEQDISNGGSEALVPELVLSGSGDNVAAGIRTHLDAGADHVCIQDIGPDPLASFRALAGVLFG
ncbi:MAG TPA: LLM class F420-dependent oxidoreductase [Acidimicrobiia bacterium]|nr:LLM class F420-dependent oxidoreductase [Acidimicrobiia bacterium]